MKNIILTIICVIFTTSVIIAQETQTEEVKIREVIKTAYVDGLQNNGNVEDIEKGFHPGFNLLGVHDNMLNKFPIYSWIESFKKRKAKNPEPPTEEEIITCDYLLIDITGNAAMAKIQLNKNGELIFTDYLQLYKFDDGWKIVSKIYYRH